MRLHEYEAADIFEAAGIPVPARVIVSSPEDARKAAETLGRPVVIKAQVLVGGRGKAGGVLMAETPDEAYTAAKSLLGSTIKGCTVSELLAAVKSTIERELYLGITVDGAAGKPVAIVSAAGGMSIEDAARERPDLLATRHLQPGRAMMPWEARLMFRDIGFGGRDLLTCADILARLSHVFTARDALIAEINPLALGGDGTPHAVDAVLEVDDSARFRHKDSLPDPLARIEHPRERRGREIGVTYVELDGDIGLISSGAGLGMATMDVIGRRLRPANFLETGGGITADLMYDAMTLVCSKPGLRGVFITVYGGINPIHEGAKGVVRYLRERTPPFPVVAKALGNRQEETWDILRAGGVHVVTGVATETAVARLEELVGPETPSPEGGAE